MGHSELNGKNLVHTNIRWSNVLFTSIYALLIVLEAADVEGFGATQHLEKVVQIHLNCLRQ